jgi:RNA polymerase sigma-70 factor (ECF subfamily)
MENVLSPSYPLRHPTSMTIEKPPVAGPARAGLPSDEEIALRVRAGETALFEVLMRRHNQRLYRTIRSLLKDEAEIEDAMQQAYIQAFTHLDQFEGGAQFSTWLTRIALNEALQRLRQRNRWVAMEDSEDQDAQEDGMKLVQKSEPSPEQQAFGRELARLMEKTIDELPELYRTVFILREVERMSTAEAGEVLGVTPEVVKKRLHRAKAAIRERMDAYLGSSLSEAFSFHASRCDRVVAAVLGRIAPPSH